MNHCNLWKYRWELFRLKGNKTKVCKLIRLLKKWWKISRMWEECLGSNLWLSKLRLKITLKENKLFIIVKEEWLNSELSWLISRLRLIIWILIWEESQFLKNKICKSLTLSVLKIFPFKKIFRTIKSLLLKFRHSSMYWRWRISLLHKNLRVKYYLEVETKIFSLRKF